MKQKLKSLSNFSSPMVWSLYQEKEFLNPLKFSNGKSQEDIVREVLDAIKEGNKIIFIRGMCGTGKSAIALNIAKNLGKTSIVVPGKTLQRQYKNDYEDKKYLLKDNGEKLKISVITGRKNHECLFLKENKSSIPKYEMNSTLNDIFDTKREKINSMIERDSSADNKNIPCKIEINEKNWNKIKDYLRQNREINWKEVKDIKDVKRAHIAIVCPYWSPVTQDKNEMKCLGKCKTRNYSGLNDSKFTFYQRREGCKFYEQFNSYIDSDVIVFNSLKYKLESVLNRKPKTEVEIIDECDEFLDSFSNERNINIDRLQNVLIHTMGNGEKEIKQIQDIAELVKEIKRDERIGDITNSSEIISLRETPIYDLLSLFLDYPEFLWNVDEESYLFDIEETAKIFEDFLDETFVTFDKKDNNLYARIVTTNLAKKFKTLLDKNKNFVLMSGTIHSEEVLRDIFGLEKFKIIEAETEQQGKIEVVKTGLEFDCKYSNFSSGKTSRKDYLEALEKCVNVSKKPTLVHVNSFTDLPTAVEIKEYNLKVIPSREKLIEMQDRDKEGKLIDDFKNKEIDILFSTKTSRGVDFPGEECNSIVFTKYPNPNVQEAFWKILNKTKPQHYWAFYKDKARRELLQKIYRGLRFKNDHIYLLSPDLRVLNSFDKI